MKLESNIDFKNWIIMYILIKMYFVFMGFVAIYLHDTHRIGYGSELLLSYVFSSIIIFIFLMALVIEIIVNLLIHLLPKIYKWYKKKRELKNGL